MGWNILLVDSNGVPSTTRRGGSGRCGSRLRVASERDADQRWLNGRS